MPVEIKPPAPKAEVADNSGRPRSPRRSRPPAEQKRGQAPPPTPSTKAALAKQVSSKGLLKVIGSAAAAAAPSKTCSAASSGVGDMASALVGASGVGVATADSLAAGGPKGGTAGSAAGIGDLAPRAAATVALAEKTTVHGEGRRVDAGARGRRARTSIARSWPPTCARRKGAIQQCYEKELKRNPSLKGKVVVRFSITPAGRTTDIDIEENTLGNEAVGQLHQDRRSAAGSSPSSRPPKCRSPTRSCSRRPPERPENAPATMAPAGAISVSGEAGEGTRRVGERRHGAGARRGEGRPACFR